MKLYKSIFAVAAAALSLGFTACENDFDRPPVIVPEATYEVNTAISEFKEMFESVTLANNYTTIPLTADGDSIIIGGRVISSDVDGNVYQQVVIRDESGAITFRIYGYDLNESYPMGQDIRVNVTGLLVGGYGKLMQIGVLYNNGVGGMDKEEFLIRAQRNGLPDIQQAQPIPVSMDDLGAWKSNTEKLMEWQSQLVRIDDVSFVGGGSLKWTDNPGNTGYSYRTLRNAAGVEIDVRTSNKCTFAGEILPKGTGSVVALLGYYNTNWQLLFMDPQTGCIDGFEFVDSPDDENPGETIFSETFSAGIGDFTIENVTIPQSMEAIWKYDSKYGMVATGYANNENFDSDSWLISPEIDLTGRTSASVSYEQALNFFADIATAKTQATINIRETGSTDWTTLTVPTFPESLGWTFIPTGNIDISAFAGKKIQLGFHYTSTAAKAGTWELKNVTVK